IVYFSAGQRGGSIRIVGRFATRNQNSAVIEQSRGVIIPRRGHFIRQLHESAGGWRVNFGRIQRRSAAVAAGDQNCSVVERGRGRQPPGRIQTAGRHKCAGHRIVDFGARQHAAGGGTAGDQNRSAWQHGGGRETSRGDQAVGQGELTTGRIVYFGAG